MSVCTLNYPVNYFCVEFSRDLSVSMVIMICSGAGVIDRDYRGNVGVILFNFGVDKFEVRRGDRVAQLICERIFTPTLLEVEQLDDTERGAGGFGSTGKQ